MPSAVLIRRSRRSASSGGFVFVLALIFALLAIAALSAAAALLAVTSGLPDVALLEAQFGMRGAEAYRPLLVYDRTGEHLLYQHLNERAQSRRWVDPETAPSHIIETTIVALDPDFWNSPGYRLILGLSPGGATITERLVDVALMPPGVPSFTRNLQRATLAADLTNRYPKEEILAWYLNSADYGHAAYGIDSAALVYYGKHAADLTLGESAALAGLLVDPSTRSASSSLLGPYYPARAERSDTETGQAPWPVGQPTAARQDRQAAEPTTASSVEPTTASSVEPRDQILARMAAAGMISRAQAASAGEEELPNLALAAERQVPPLAESLLEQLASALGENLHGRSGLKVISTIDYDLQTQAACAADSHVRRLSGDSIGAVSPAGDGSPCVSAALLPTLRPRDASVDHAIEEWSVVVLDPIRGEVLAAQGPFSAARHSDPMLDPFVYLTAFARGSTPSTMVVDLGDGQSVGSGPVRMRTALANLYAYAASATRSAIGKDSLGRTLMQMGLNPESADEGFSLLDLSSAYGVIAAEGQHAGVEDKFAPSLVLAVHDSEGRNLYKYTPALRAVASPQLAYLIVDILSDESARWDRLGRGNSLEIGRPAGAISASTADMHGNWSLGFTPQRVVGVRLGGSPTIGLDATNGAAAIWNAVARFASADLPTQSWDRPAGLTELEVCDPSGLLPTQYCPHVVRELFIQGTEPTQYDNLYRPFRINRETGKLATLFTPLQSVEEQVFLVPPSGAEEWAAAVGIEQPPQEYDTLPTDLLGVEGVQINSPDPFETVAGEVTIRGDAYPQGFEYYRLQFGQGLNPTNWVQIGLDQRNRVEAGRLGAWDTSGLGGLYTLQLMVVLRDGQIQTAALPVTLDNEAPEVEMLKPIAGENLHFTDQAAIVLQAAASDDVSLERVEFFVDGRRVGSKTSVPFSLEWKVPSRAGDYELFAKAFDTAGNQAESPSVLIEVVP